MLKLSVIKVSPNTLRPSKIQTYRMIQCPVIGDQKCQKWANFWHFKLRLSYITYKLNVIFK